ncbi:unnamed protein product [Rotaria sordida]|uniref:Uncharacterized protein n=1 Tax=Rotaria sordida TaxID=392033 RepID=A0A815ZNQ8_9BILA|nr:unnamed protein product [Rotaria sordida]CAF1587140.1 unnamed protein product [Rotaria sordida]
MERMLKPMNASSQQPPLVCYPVDSRIVSDLILDNFNSNDELNIDDELLNMLTNEMCEDLPEITQFDDIIPQFNNRTGLQNEQQSEKTMLNHLESNMFIQTNNSLTESIVINDAILAQTISQDYNQLCNTPLISDKLKVHPKQSTTVTPINYILEPNTFIQCNTPQIPSYDLIYKREFLQNDIIKSNKIQIKCQPRSKFRPRTLNESKISSHYLRCEDDDELDYPAIYIPQIWACQSDINIIEVALMDINKQPHPYVIDNKISKKLFDDQTLIFKENKPNVLYFLLTKEDFLNGYKSFMIELIKSKQDDIITKKLIQLRKLDQSMLRFIRIYRDEYGNYQRDINGEEYSCIMTESYGDVTVEHIGPRYGPMCGQSMIFIVLKGRIIKDDLSIIVCEQTTKWSQKIKKFILNGNVIYFAMPAFPYLCMNNIKASINIYYKNQQFHESTYLYMNFVDEELVDLNLNDRISDINDFITKKKLNHDIVNNTFSMPLTSQKISKNKARKRLNSKQIS